MPTRQFAFSVVEKLQSAGFQALWAGGCVRDRLLGVEPTDFDVATSAHPDQIRELFGERRTLAIGAAFGVITVLGPRSAGQIEVATFRRDTDYSDGRHPDAVEFTDAREDAIRRDFTINGMFYDPLTTEVIDYVGGREDLKRKRIRAIGNPHERIEEDKLRMLRGVRFAAAFGFEIEPKTYEAIRNHAAEITLVSPERIGIELIRMLSHPSRSIAAELLVSVNLWNAVLPAPWQTAVRGVAADGKHSGWQRQIDQLRLLESDDFEPAAFVLLQSFFSDRNSFNNSFNDSPEDLPEDSQRHRRSRSRIAAGELQAAWRLTNQQRDSISWIARHWQTLAVAHTQPWSRVQPLVVHADIAAGLAVAHSMLGPGETGLGIDFCRERLGWAPQELDPPALLDGKDLIALGIRPGPQFKRLLQQVRDGQLDGTIKTSVEAEAYVVQRVASQ